MFTSAIPRHSALVWLAAVLLAAPGLGAVDREYHVDGLRFSDGRMRSEAELSGYVTVRVFFCGHCPNAAQMMSTNIKKLHDRIDRERLPVRLICVTPDKPIAELQQWQKTLGMADALVAYDPINLQKIGLQNIIQTGVFDGQGMAPRGGGGIEQTMVALAAKATYRYPPTGISDDKVKTLWWMFERGRPGAGAGMVQGLAVPAAKAECEKLLAILRAHRDGILAGADITTVEKLEILAQEWVGMPAAELTPIAKRLDELRKDKALADEFTARAAFVKTLELVNGKNKAQQLQGKEYLSEIIKRYPETMAGKRAKLVHDGIVAAEKAEKT